MAVKNAVIRTARVSDAQALAELLSQLGYPSTTGFVQKKLKKVSKKDDRVMVATLHGEVVGFVSCHIVPLIHQSGNLCRITALVVADGFRNSSIGRKLMNAVERYAQTRRCIKIEVTSGQHRSQAHRFYGRLGYREVSRRFLKDLDT
jgi:ribosomal protein S18 acetylase RimI-like enzyme